MRIILIVLHSIRVFVFYKAGGEAGEVYLVLFEDDNISIIPKRNVLGEEIAVCQVRTITWTGGRRYHREILFIGMFTNLIINLTIRKGSKKNTKDHSPYKGTYIEYRN